MLLLGGQVVSLLITGTGVWSQLLAERGVDLPTTQSFLNYLLLSLFLIPHYHSYTAKRRRHALLPQPILPSQSSLDPSLLLLPTSSTLFPYSSSPPSFLSVAWYWYLLLALCDVEGNFLLVTAYQHTSITSIQLLDCFTIPMIMMLSYCLFRHPYTRQHIAGALVCLAGMSLLIVSDRLQRPSSSSSSSNQLLGDALVLLGCCCYAVSNLGQERIVKAFDRTEFLAMIGAFGSLVSLAQILVTERAALAAMEWTWERVGFVLAFVGCLVALYLAVPVLLQRSSALFMNLSILTSDFWAVLVAYLLFSAHLHALYFVAFALIIAGLVLYNLAEAGGGVKEALRAIIGGPGEGRLLIPSSRELSARVKASGNAVT